ncbi:hypothetical protein MY1884_002018 [Beauveria asiatica]
MDAGEPLQVKLLLHAGRDMLADSSHVTGLFAEEKAIEQGIGKATRRCHAGGDSFARRIQECCRRAVAHRRCSLAAIIAVPGLGAHPYHTWEARKPQGPSAADYQAAQPARVHLLKDLLARDFPEARVWNFAHDSNRLIDAPVKTTAEIGKCLLAEIKDKRLSPHLPIIFIGHSLGGMQPGQVTAQGVRRIDPCSTRQIKSEYSSPQTHSFLSTTNHDHLMGCFGLVATDDDDLTSTEDTFLTAARQCNW